MLFQNTTFLTRTLGSLTEQFRIFLACSIIGVYGLVLYEVLPELLFDVTNSLLYFAAPTSVVVSVLVVLPKFATKNTETKSATPQTDLLSEMVTEGTQQAPSQENAENIDISKIGSANTELDALLAGNSGIVTGEAMPVTTNTVDESRIHELVDQKFEPIENDLTTFKKDLNKIKEDMKYTKDAVDVLASSFEGTLTDMKAFQTEISNPLNFMRKYFESLDISKITDPSLPLRNGLIPNPLQNQHDTQANQISPQPQDKIQIAMGTAGNIQTNTSQANPSSGIIRGSEMDTLMSGSDLKNPIDSVMKPLFSGSLSVANMMAIIELVGEMLAEKGDDCIDLLVDQCKLMGLKPEDESTIYNIIDLLKTSNMSVEQSISQLYRFAKIVGLNDREADAYYARLTAQKSIQKRSI